MKKIAFLLLSAALFSACRNTEYESYLETMSLDNVTKVSLNPNSPVLVADGVAELTFVVKAFMNVENKRTVEVVINGENVVRDSVFKIETLVKADRLSVDEMEIRSSRGEIIENFKYSTDTGAGTEIEFTCTVGGKVSAPCKVRLIEKPAPYTKEIVVPVVFHIMSYTTNLSKCNAITGVEVGKHIDHANKAFGAQLYPTAPSCVDSKIRFVLATHDPNGKLLSEPGIDRHDFGSSMSGYTNNKANYLWDPEKYLNIYVYNTYSTNSTSGPQSILSSVTAIPGLPSTMKVVNDNPSEYNYGTSDTHWGIIINVDDFKKLGQAGTSTRFEQLLGMHYGLIRTYSTAGIIVDGDVDYCSDTYTYISSPPVTNEKRTYLPPDSTEGQIYYNSFNIMDALTTSSVITPEQIARVRFVMENCPGRRAGWK